MKCVMLTFTNAEMTDLGTFIKSAVVIIHRYGGKYGLETDMDLLTDRGTDTGAWSPGLRTDMIDIMQTM